jgi:hypothetical protein
LLFAQSISLDNSTAQILVSTSKAAHSRGSCPLLNKNQKLAGELFLLGRGKPLHPTSILPDGPFCKP